jgi:hypothetical protein
MFSQLLSKGACKNCLDSVGTVGKDVHLCSRQQSEKCKTVSTTEMNGFENGYANTPQCYVIGTLLVSLENIKISFKNRI